MNDRFLLLVLAALVVTAGGALYWRLRSRSLPVLTDDEFLRDFSRRRAIVASSEVILEQRRRVASILGIPAEKLMVDQAEESLSHRIGYLTDFSAAWNDLLYEASEAWSDANLEEREHPPVTIGEIIEDLLRA